MQDFVHQPLLLLKVEYALLSLFNSPLSGCKKPKPQTPAVNPLNPKPSTPKSSTLNPKP